MKRLSIGLQLLCALLLSVNGVAHAAPAHAGKKKAKKGAVEAVPVSAEISKSMNELSWGMTKDELQNQLITKIKEKYRPLVSKTRDAVEEDRLRTAASDEMKRIRDSFVDFKGTSTGWDVSFLRGEFTHGNAESMLVSRDQNSQNFYFFIHGKLWKWYKAFDAEVFRAGDFQTFANSVQKRFGPARDASGELSASSGKRHWLEWQDDKTRLRAVDQSDFYGFYCLVFEQKATVENLAKLRTHTREVAEKQNALVDAVTAPASQDDSDRSPDVVDSITGKSHGNRDSATASAKGAKGRKAAAAPAAPPRGVTSDDDPLNGL